jgi:hypothetical protein
MVDQGVLHARRAASNERKRSYSNGEARDAEPKRRSVEASSSYSGLHTPSYPVSSLYQSHRDPETSNGSHSRRKSKNASSQEEGYPGQYDHFRDYPLTQSQDTGSSFPSQQTKSNNRFNLSRYQLDEAVELAPNTVLDPAEKPNRFKTQRERIMLAADSEEDEEEEEEESRSLSSESQSQSQDSYMSQRERLRRFSSEQSRHVVIPNEWEGEQKLQEFVAFGNIEAALRPLGLMMARAALVSDSVTTRHARSSSTGPSCCHSGLGNPRTL